MQVDADDGKVATKQQRQASEQLFGAIIGLNKYINPINSKTLDQMKSQSLKANDIYLKPAGDSSKVKG